MHVLILGGTRFVGRHITEAALARGHRVTLFNRGQSADGAALFPCATHLVGDRAAGDYAALEGLEFDAVVDTCAYYPRAIRQALDALAPGLSGAYAFISSVSAFASLEASDQDESAPLASLDDPETEEVTGETYGGLKAACERALEDALGARALILRPGLIVGPHDTTDRFTYWPARVARGGEFLAPGDPGDHVQFIDARDLADFTLGALERAESGAFNLVGPSESETIGGLVEACVAELAPDATPVWTSAAELEALEITPWSDMPVWVPPVGETAGFARVSNARAVAAGLTTRSTREIVRDTHAWWSSLDEERRASPRAGLDPERERDALSARA